MAVAYDASSESHTGTAGSVSSSGYTWTHTPVASPKGALVFTFALDSTEEPLGVFYGFHKLAPVARAVDTAGEPGECRAWIASDTVGDYRTTTLQSSGVSVALNKVAYANGYWVAVGESGTILYATSPGGTWSAATSGVTSTLYGIAYGNGYWVASGSSSGSTATILYATDPSGTWTAASGLTNTTAYNCRYDNGYWVVAAADGVYYRQTTPNGTWSAAGTPGSANGYRDVAYANGYWVACGINALLSYRAATDPAGSWTANNQGGTQYSLIYANGYWITVGRSGATGDSIRYKATDPTGTWSSLDLAYNDINTIATDGTNLMFGASRGFVGHGTVPSSWTYWLGSTENINSIAYANGYWVAVGASGSIRSWTKLNPDDKPTPLATGAQPILVTRKNLSIEGYAVAVTVTADYAVEAIGEVLLEGDGTLAEQNVNDGSPGTNSMRFAGLFSGLAAVPSAGANSTALQSIDFGNLVAAVVRETTGGQGSRPVGFSSGTSDDRAAVHLAIREAIVPWTVGVPIR